MRSSVTVTGPPSAIWRRKIGTTEPDEPSTLPKRTVAKRVVGPALLRRLDRPLGQRLRRAHHRRRRDGLVGRDEHEALDARARPRRAPSAAWRARCCARPRPGWPPSARRACRRRRGRRPSGGARRTPRASARPPCSRRAPARASTGGRGGRPRARAGSRKRLSSAWSTQDQPPRRDARDLAAQLGADRAAGAGDHARPRR